MNESTLTFLGAAGTVTGSKHLVRHAGRAYLLDAGLHQGPDELEQLDWQPFPLAMRDLDAVVLSHAHIDHTGYLPRLVQQGYDGPAYATPATISLLKLLLPDSAHIQEEQADYANRKGYARHKPAKPLYTSEDADRALALLRPVPFGEPLALDQHATLTYRRAGHLLGSATVQLDLHDGRDAITVAFSGDLGRYAQEVMQDPEPIPHADHLILESTYGDSFHPRGTIETTLARAVDHVTRARGALIIPSFAVGRTQLVLYYLRKLEDAQRIPRLPVFVDSPMASDATDIYCQNGSETNLRIELLMDDERCPLRCPDTSFVRKSEESKRLNARHGPFVVISANGMCTAGRILHHLKNRLPDARNAVLFVGYQGEGTRGRRLVEGARHIHMHGQEVPVRAAIYRLDGLSGHADQGELLRWCEQFSEPPRATHLVHGEPPASHALARALGEKLGWRAQPARRLDVTHLKGRHA